jgi:hypothetical protein
MKNTSTSNKNVMKIVIKEQKNPDIIINSKKNKILTKEEKERELMYEGMLGNMFGAMGGAVITRFKKFLASKLLGLLGINQGGIMAQVFINAAGNLSAEDIMTMIKGDKTGQRCPVIAQKILEACEETLLQKLPEMFGMKPGGMVTKLVQQAVINSIVRNNKFTMNLSKAICNIKGPQAVAEFKMLEEQRTKKLKNI